MTSRALREPRRDVDRVDTGVQRVAADGSSGWTWGETVVEGRPAALQAEARAWRRQAEAQRAIAGAPPDQPGTHGLLAHHALTVTGATTALVLDPAGGLLAQAGEPADPADPDDPAELLAAAGERTPQPWRQGSAIAVGRRAAPAPEPWSVVLVVGSSTTPLPASAGELCAGLLEVASARLEGLNAVAMLARIRRQREEGQRLARVGSWEWTATTPRPGDLFDDGGGQSWSPMFYELLGLVAGSVEPSAQVFMAALHEEDRALPGQAVVAAIKSGCTSYFDFRVPLPDGSLRWLQGTAECELDAAGNAVRAWGTALDITDRRRAEGELRAAETQFRLAMEFAPVGVALVGLDGRAIRVNPPLSEMLGRSPADLVAADVGRLVHPQDLGCARSAADDLLGAGRVSADCELRLQRADGSYVWTHSSASMLLNSDGEPQHIIVHVQDYTERRKHQLDLERQANTDPLTGLMNRRGWEAALLTHLDIALEGGEPMAIGLLDLDHFKVYNDTFGHPAGDRLLTEAARVWTARLVELAGGGRLAAIARIGGEEFGVVLPGSTAEEAREVIVELCRLTPRGQTTSGGVTVWSPGEDVSDTLARADGALYSAKRKGRRRVIAVLPA